MPYELFEHDGQHCLRNQATGKLIAGSCHANKADTMAMMRALYANVPDARRKDLDMDIIEADLPDYVVKALTQARRRGQSDTAETQNKSMDQQDENDMNESLIYYGGEVKALGGGKISGHLAIFTEPSSPDLQGDYFTKDTDFFLESGETRPILYRHGAHPVIKSRKLGRATLSVDDVGVFLQGELNLRDKYEKAIYKLAEMGKLGWSSGSMGHLVTRKPSGKSMEIVTWPIGEASLTPNPVEGRTSAFPIKSLADDDLDLDAFIKSLEQQATDQSFDLAGTPAIARFCEAVAPASLKDGTQRSAAAADAIKEFITIGRIVGEAFYSDHSRLVRRGEHRFVKSNREIDAATLEQTRIYIQDIKEVQAAFEAVKSTLEGILKVSEMGVAQQKALDEQARFELWNFGRITGKTPEELDNE